jgi:hypothetical protein
MTISDTRPPLSIGPPLWPRYDAAEGRPAPGRRDSHRRRMNHPVNRFCQLFDAQAVYGQGRRADAPLHDQPSPVVLIEKMGNDQLGNTGPGHRHDRPGTTMVDHTRYTRKEFIVRQITRHTEAFRVTFKSPSCPTALYNGPNPCQTDRLPQESDRPVRCRVPHAAESDSDRAGLYIQKCFDRRRQHTIRWCVPVTGLTAIGRRFRGQGASSLSADTIRLAVTCGIR